MALEKAVLLNTQTRESIPVQFNPEEYSLESGNVFAEMPVAGLPAPPLQYVRGNGRSLKMELFFDTSIDGPTDVRRQSARVIALLDKDPTLMAPPPLIFSWGGFTLPCVLEKVSQRYTRFLSNGVPVRAYLSVVLREYAAATVSTGTGLFFLPSTIQNLAGGVTLSQVAADSLGDPANWRVIARQNNIDNPRTLDGRQTLTLPPRPGG